MRYRNLLVIANSFPTNCEMYVVNIYLQTEVTFYKDNAEPQKGVNTSALTLWFVNSDGFWSLSSFQGRHSQICFKKR